MTATLARRVAPLLITALLAGGVSLASTAVAAPAVATSGTADTDDDNLRTIKRLNAEKPRTVKKLVRTVEKYGITDGRQWGPGVGNVDGHEWARGYRTPCKQLDCLQN
ncbi:hypothetical protein AVW11_34650 [Streptomyces amritsarensis]|uniref:Secreted protein n=1 Tax=Streptomyces amritsarensis TaxID=681158 RepID=A0ABX3FSN8_9ACTN|nr:hypothetical protein [Streptomyces amritsarensis]OLZ45094.1 hypothetical protein AVW11_34650 [Streptomyces amritsarensis]